MGKAETPLQTFGRGRLVQRSANKVLEGREEPKLTWGCTGEREGKRAAPRDQHSGGRPPAHTCAHQGCWRQHCESTTATQQGLLLLSPPSSLTQRPHQDLLLAGSKCRPAGKGVWKMSLIRRLLAPHNKRRIWEKQGWS